MVMPHVTPIELVKILDEAERRWFRTKLRERTPDRDRYDAKKIFMVRALTLIPMWRRVSK